CGQDEQSQSRREFARLRARLMDDRQDYLRQLIAQLDVVLPEHRTALGDLLSARARGLLAQFPTAQHLAQASPRAIRRAAEDAGTRGFSLDDATAVRDAARRSIYRGKDAPARSPLRRRRPRLPPTPPAVRSIAARPPRPALTWCARWWASSSVSPARWTRSTAPRRRCCPPASQALGPPTPSCCRPSRASALRRPPPCSVNS